MDLEALNLDNLGHGKARAEFEEALGEVIRDVHGRRQLKKKRTVTLTVSITPEYDPEIDLNIPTIDHHVETKTPRREGTPQRARMDADGNCLVQPSDHLADPEAAQTDFSELGNVEQLPKQEQG